MILVDTSIWVNNARRAIAALSDLLGRGVVLGHPFVAGELALGGFEAGTLRLLSELPRAIVASHDEVMSLIQRERLASRGVGYVDVHLLASARLTDRAQIWTFDKPMSEVADKLGVIVFKPGRAS